MMRRRFLAGVAAGALAGCATPQPTDEATPAVPDDDLVRSVPRDAIPAITKPAFAPDWTDVTVDVRNEFEYTASLELAAFDDVIGVVSDGDARAYPLRVLNWHEVVNDHFGGPLLVTYCPLCRSAIVADRRVDGTVTDFGVDGRLYRGNLVMYDVLTESLWSQLSASAIRGPATGETLSLHPASFTTWRAWHDQYPDTDVLLPPPFSATVRGRGSAAQRDYTQDPYGGYETNRDLGPGVTNTDDSMHPKTHVIGLDGDPPKAYPLPAVRRAGAVNDVVDGTPVVVTVAPDDTLVAYHRRVDGTTLTFTVHDDTHLFADGSRWHRARGTAIDGPHDGTTLERATDTPPLFWFAWHEFHPDTTAYPP